MSKSVRVIIPLLILLVVIGILLYNPKNPILIAIPLGSVQFTIHKYGLAIVTAILVGQWIASIEVRRRGEHPDHVLDGLIWAVVPGIIGARLWYVANDLAGGGQTYIDRPLSILFLWEGGLHVFGALLFGALGFWIFARRRKLDMWLVLDSVGPGLMIPYGFVRIANFVNQELYGPPTSLPWGIRIEPHRRIPLYQRLDLYPETTRFHPTFAYDTIYNLLAGVFLLWIVRRNKDKERPGAAFAGWLILAGVGRQIIEFFRPDQPRIPGTDISYTRIAAALMIVAGALLLAIKYERLHLPFLPPGRKEYRFAPPLYPDEEEDKDAEGTDDEAAGETGDESVDETEAEPPPEESAEEVVDESDDDPKDAPDKSAAEG
jgi:phosphatidylglycerol:prolipoprotein diacylglycerol transferase